MRQRQETQLKRRGGDVGLKVVSSHGSSYSEDDIEVGMTSDVQFWKNPYDLEQARAKRNHRTQTSRGNPGKKPRQPEAENWTRGNDDR